MSDQLTGPDSPDQTSPDQTSPGAGSAGPDSPGTEAVIEDYLERLRRAALVGGSAMDDDDIADLRAHLWDRLARASGPDLHGAPATDSATTPTDAAPEDVARALAELGTPEALAAEFAAGRDDDTPGQGADAAHGGAVSTGRLLGIPYDLRVPSAERYATRWWDPLDRRVMVPKAWGVGWTVNLGALAVRAGLVRPDDEDVPFATVPPRAVAATLAAPGSAVAAFVILAAVTWSRLPAQVPTHWGWSGQADDHGSRGALLLWLTAFAVVPFLVAVVVHVRPRPSLDRVGASAVGLSAAALSVTILAQTFYTVHGGTGVWPIWAGIVACLALPLALLVRVSRIGRAAEQQRDLAAAVAASVTPKGTAR